MRELALELNNVVKRYGKRRALDGLNLVVPRGSAFGLVGSNGAGKTTTLCAVIGILRTQRGTIRILGQDGFHPASAAGRVSLMPQDAALPLYANVHDLLIFYGRLQGLSRSEADADATRVLEQVHLTDRAAASIRSLSHGMRRRVVIAQALLGHPEVILLDEPLSGLDPREVVHLRKILMALKGKQTLVLSSHNLYEIELICDHVAFIENGRTLRQDRMTAVTGRLHCLTYVLERPADPQPMLEEAFPDLEFRTNGDRVHCTYDTTGHTAADVNTMVLPRLLEAGFAINEVRRGTQLEEVYLGTGT